MQRIDDLDKWMQLPQDQSLQFSNPMPRVVRLQVNAPRETRLYVTDEESGELTFLALVKGRDTVEFGCRGAFSLSAEGGAEDAVWIYTVDGADVSIVNEVPESFTRIVERRARNPELERMMAVMQRNVDARLQQATRELEGRLQRGQETRGPLPAATGFPDRPAQTSGQADGAAPSDPQASPAGGSGEGGTTDAPGGPENLR